MKSSLIIFFVLILSSSCSSTQTNRHFASDEPVKLNDDLNWVDALDFDKKTETKYEASKDENKNVSSKDEEKIAVVKESIATLPLPRLEEQLKESSDPLSKIVIRCYQGKFDEAFTVIDQIYSQFKNNTSYWNQVGTCYYLKSDYSKAILFYNKSRDLDSKFAPPYNNLGVVYQKQGRFQKALAAFKKASEISAFSITPAYNIARLYLQFGVTSKAQPILLGLYKKSPEDGQVATALATTYLMNSDYQNALTTFQSMPKENLVKPEVGINYALTLKLLGKNDEAKLAYANVLEVSSEMKLYAQDVDNFIRK
jgi:tetratricopeptide (TPR) repeat protein